MKKTTYSSPEMTIESVCTITDILQTSGQLEDMIYTEGSWN